MGQTKQQKTKYKTSKQRKLNVKMYRNMEQNKTNNQKRISDYLKSKTKQDKIKNQSKEKQKVKMQGHLEHNKIRQDKYSSKAKQQSKFMEIWDKLKQTK